MSKTSAKSAEQRVTDQYDDLSNSWTFGVYLGDELHSSVRISVLTSEWRQSCSAEAFGEVPDRYGMIGSLLIVASGLYALHREVVRRRAIAAVVPPGEPGS